MGTLFLVEQGSKVHRTGERLVIKKDEKVIFESPVHHINNVICYGNVQLTTQTITLLLKQKVDVSFMTEDGQLLGRLMSFVPNKVGVKQEQLRCAEDSVFAVQMSKAIVNQKILAMLSVLRQRRNQSLKVDKSITDKLQESLKACAEAREISQLRGVEGIATRWYFSAWDQLLPNEMKFQKRSRMPAHNAINGLINYFYTILTNEVVSIIEANNLSASIGHLHSYKNNRASLALDLIEPFRSVVIDRWLIQLIRRKEITLQDFNAANQVRLTIEAKKKLLSKYQAYRSQIQLHSKLHYLVKAYHTSINKKEISQFEITLQRVLSYLL